MSWYKKIDNDIMISTRIRIARNLKKYPFSSRMGNGDEENLIKDVEGAIYNSNSAIANDFKTYKMREISKKDALSLLEEHFISPDLLEKNSAVLINSEKSVSIMINEEDHIRAQVILPGEALDEAWDIANKIDDLLDENLEFAFSEDFGYKTSCITNLGTGLRASVMMHLPALSLSGEIKKIISSARNLGFAIRGIYGEGSDASGNLYQISNQITFGETEEDLIKKTKNIAKKIENYEKEARQRLINNHKIDISDRVSRAYGILKYAKKISSTEAKALLSDVLLGKALGILTLDAPIIELMIKTEPANISKEESLSAEERDIKRGEIINKALGE